MRTARFANVAIASSLKRLRPNFYHKTYPGRIPIVIQRQQSTSQHARNRFEYGSTRPSARQEDVQWQAEEVAELGAEREQQGGILKQKVLASVRPHQTDEIGNSSFKPIESTELEEDDYGISNEDRQRKINSLKDTYNHAIGRTENHKAKRTLKQNHDLLTGAARISRTEIDSEDGWCTMPIDLETGEFDTINFRWTRHYAAVYAKRLHRNADLNLAVQPEVQAQFVEFVRKLRQEWPEAYNEPGSLLPRDDAFSVVQKALVEPLSPQNWPDFMMLLMLHLPGLTPQVLRRTYASARPPSYMIADTLDFIVRFCTNVAKGEANSELAVEKLSPSQAFQLILDMVSRAGSENKSLHQKTIERLVPELSITDAYALFYGLQAFNTVLPPAAYLSFAECFASCGRYDTACEALELYVDNRGLVSRLGFKAITAKILRKSILSPTGYHDSSWIISRFMDMGHTVGVQLQNVLISNAFDSDDQSTALNVFQLMREQGTEPDAYTYAAMLKGLRNSTDEQFVEDMLGMAWACAEEKKSVYLAGEVLYWHFAQHVRKAQAIQPKEEKSKIYTEALHQLVSLYSRLYDNTFLEVLQFQNLVPREAWASTSLNLQPDDFVIALMILAYTRTVRVIADANPHEEETPHNTGTNFRLYQRFWLLATRHKLYPDVPEYVKTTFRDCIEKSPRILNIFMDALGVHTSTLFQAVKILQLMDEGSYKSRPIRRRMHEQTVTQLAGPNLISWSILLNAFARHGQVEAAQKCFDTMLAKEITLDAVTYNTLVKAYAVVQDVGGVINALRQKEQAGFGMDEGILRTLWRVRDKKVLREVLEREVIARDGGLVTKEGALMGRGAEDAQRKKWSPKKVVREGYEPGVGSRSVMWFDGNRMAGLQREAWATTETSEEEGAYSPVRSQAGDGEGRILEGQGVYSLKSEDEKDWFEDDEEEGDGHPSRDDFDWSPMESGRDVPSVR